MNMFRNHSDGFAKLPRNDGAKKIGRPITEKKKMDARRKQFNEAFDALITRTPEPRYRKFNEEQARKLDSKLAELGYTIRASEIPENARGLVTGIPPVLVIEEIHGKKRLGYYHRNPDRRKGGFVEIDCCVDPSCTIDASSAVLDCSRLYPGTEMISSIAERSKIEKSSIVHADVYGSMVTFSSITGCDIKACVAVFSRLNNDRTAEILVEAADHTTAKGVTGEIALERFLDAILPTDDAFWRKVETENKKMKEALAKLTLLLAEKNKTEEKKEG